MGRLNSISNRKAEWARGSSSGKNRKIPDIFICDRGRIAEKLPTASSTRRKRGGVLLWNMFPQYQAPASLRENEWNHIKMVISGLRMNIGDCQQFLWLGAILLLEDVNSVHLEQ
jgi:hypothetical protein